MSASKAQRATTAKRRADAIKLKLAGLDYEAIAERLGYSSRQAAAKDIERALTAYIKVASEGADEMRRIELMRLDRLQASAWPKALGGDLKAIETCLKIITERRKLLGLDAPTQVEVFTIDALDAEIRKLEAQLSGASPTGEVEETAEADQ